MKRVALALACVGALAALTHVSAQQQIVGGRTLDNSLMQGSAGFNAGRLPGMSAQSYQVNRNRSLRPANQRYRAGTVTFQGGGGSSVATYGRGGYSTAGTGLQVATYNPLSKGVRVQRGQTSTYARPISTRPAGTSYGYRPPKRASPTRSYAPKTYSAGLARPTYTTLRR